MSEDSPPILDSDEAFSERDFAVHGDAWDVFARACAAIVPILLCWTTAILHLTYGESGVAVNLLLAAFSAFAGTLTGMMSATRVFEGWTPVAATSTLCVLLATINLA